MKKEYYYKIIEAKDRLNYDSVYLRTNEIKDEVPKHYRRPLYKVINVENPNKYVIRKLRGIQMEKLNDENIILDYLSAKELGIKKGDALSLKKASFLDRNYKYFKQHPNEDIRFAYKFFLIGVIIGILSVIIGVLGLIR